MKPRQLLFAAVFATALVVPVDRAVAQDGDLFRVNVTVYDPTKAWFGFNSEIADTGGNPVFRVFSMGGAVLRTWKDPLPNWAFAELVKPLSFGRILGLIFDRATAGVSTRQKMLVELDWDGNVVWQFDARPLGFQLHHDFERLANGNTLVLAQKPRLVPSINPNLIVDDVIWEVDPQGNILWDWAASVHIGEMGFTAAELNYLANFPGTPPLSIFHMNSMQTLPPNQWEATDPRFAAGNLLVSLRETNLVFIIDKATKSIVWRYQGTIGQHHPRMIPQGLSGAGNILVLDNGGSVGAPPISRAYSRVLEINPVTMATVWEYNCSEGRLAGGQCPTFFFTKVMGAAERLPNGNTLITEAKSGRAFEVTPTGETVWEYRAQTRVYRTYRFDASWRNRGVFPKFIW